MTPVQLDKANCAWCGHDFQRRRGGSPQRFCSTKHRALFWSTLRRWGERAVAAGSLTIADIRNGDPAACTLPGTSISASPQLASARRQNCLSDDLGGLLEQMDGILGEPTIGLLIRLGWLAHDRREDYPAIVRALCRFVGHVLEMARHGRPRAGSPGPIIAAKR